MPGKSDGGNGSGLTGTFDGSVLAAAYRQTDLDLVDAFNLVNALAGGPDVPGRVSFEVEWTATSPSAPMRHEAHGFTGEFREARATVTWSGSTSDSSYISEPAATSNSIFGFIGRERNGMFSS